MKFSDYVQKVILYEIKLIGELDFTNNYEYDHQEEEEYSNNDASLLSSDEEE